MELLVPEIDRWARLKAFVAEWHAPLTEADGIPLAELVAADNRLDITLPTALKEWYRLAGRRTNITRQQNFLMLPDKLILERADENTEFSGALPKTDERVLIFHVENQTVVRWGIRESHWGQADPPVVLDATGWGVENESLSQFALQMVMFETITGGANSDYAATDREGVRACEALFPDLGFPAWHWIGEGSYQSHFRGSPGVLIQTHSPTLAQDHGRCEIQLAARTPELLKHAVSLLAFEWGSAWKPPGE